MNSPVRLPVTPTQVVPAPAQKQMAPAHRLPPPVPQARVQRRHRWIHASFILLVIAPLIMAAWYLYTRAADQYTSTVGFAVRTEKAGSGLDLLGGIPGLSALSSTSSSDTDILYEFLLSQALVAKVDQRLNLREIWSRPENDIVFRFDPDGTIEDLTKYWWRMMQVSYDPGTRLITLQAHAFAPDEARDIAAAVLEESSGMINRLSSIAQEDTTRYAREEFDLAKERLEKARLALKAFRSQTHIVDPLADLQGEMGVLGQLQQKLADELIALDMLRSTSRNLARPGGRSAETVDVRIQQAELRVQVIRERIDSERTKFGGGDGRRDYSALVGEFERLNVDLEFAQKSYVAALATLEAARADAQRQSRYLAAYVTPTLAEKPLYPKRAQILVVMAVFLGLGWAVMVLVLYNLRDRR